MTVFTSPQFPDSRPKVVPHNAGMVVASYSEVSVPNTLTINDILRMTKIPSGCVITDLFLQCDAIDTVGAVRLRVGVEKWPTDVHIRTITVTTAPDTSANASVTVDGAAHNVALLNTDDAAGAAVKIAAVIEALEGYTAAAVGAVVTANKTAGTAMTLVYAGATTNSVATVSGPEDIVAGSELTAAANPIDGAAARMLHFPEAILQASAYLTAGFRLVVKVTVQGTTRAAGKVRLVAFYRATDFGL